MNQRLGDLIGGSREAANHSFILGFLKIILACYFIVFLFEIYKHVEDSFREKKAAKADN